MDDTIAQAAHTLGLDKWVPLLLAFHMLASAVDALLPQPAEGSHWLPVRKLVSMAAGNMGNASNAAQPPLVTWLQRIVVSLAAVVPEPAPAPKTPLVAPAACPTRCFACRRQHPASGRLSALFRRSSLSPPPRRTIPMRIPHAAFGVALAGLLSGCGSSSDGASRQMYFETIKMEAIAVVATTEASVAAYNAENPLPADVMAKITAAEAAAEAVVAGLPTKAPEDVPEATAALVVAVNQITATLPAGALPKQTRAAIAAFEVLAKYLPTIVNPSAASPPS
jgi:hypothetical protein